MPKCEQCGTELIEGDLFCHSCGTPAGVENRFKTPQQEYLEPYKQSTPTRQPLYARNYWIWFLLSMLVSPIIYLYLYFNFEDLKKLDQFERPSKVPPMNIDTNKILILGGLGIFCGLALFTMPYIFYLKWEKLYQYIENNPEKQKTIPMSGKRFLAFYITYLVIAFSGVILMMLNLFVFQLADEAFLIFMIITYVAMGLLGLGFAIFNMIQSYKWQEAYNEIAYRVCPETIKQDLF